jgi:beta-1,4-mannosyl-glycoprotein beta-1,4-N-acetylglucosaminyltransferase
MKIIDCFIFYNELDLLKYRLNTLYDYIDYFIIVESIYTHSGKEKILFYETNKEMFEEFKTKIIHIILDDFPFKFPNIDYSKNEQWVNEHFQRNEIKKGIEKLNLNNEDIIILSDLDEIPDYNILFHIKNYNFKLDDIYSLEQDFYYYNLNSKKIQKWYFSKILSYDKYKKLNISFSNIRYIMDCKFIKKGGWHLSYFGDKYTIQNKIKEFVHQEFNNEKYIDVNIIEEKIKNQKDLFNRDNEDIENIPVIKNDYLPHNYEKYLMNYVLY